MSVLEKINVDASNFVLDDYIVSQTDVDNPTGSVPLARKVVFSNPYALNSDDTQNPPYEKFVNITYSVVPDPNNPGEIMVLEVSDKWQETLLGQFRGVNERMYSAYVQNAVQPSSSG